jgi:hypothetical protein
MFPESGRSPWSSPDGMEAAREGIRRGEEEERSGDDGVVPPGMAPAVIAMPPELIVGNGVGIGGWVSLLPTAAAVAGRPFLSVKVMFDPVGASLTKKIERAAGRRGLPVITYRNRHKYMALSFSRACLLSALVSVTHTHTHTHTQLTRGQQQVHW